MEEDPFDSKRVTADISLMPMGSNNVSTKKEVRKAVEIISRQGFKEVNPHAFGTNVTGNQNLNYLKESESTVLINSNFNFSSSIECTLTELICSIIY